MATLTLVEVPALCEFTHKGRSYVRGEMVECSPFDAAILARARKVSLTRHDVPRLKYLRRDLTAEE